MPVRIDLNRALLAAHARDDKRTLVRLYQDAATAAQTEGERAFFLTHAYVFALELADPAAEVIRASLSKMGRI